MNKSKHTSGPWFTTKIGAQVRDRAKRVIAFIAHYGLSAEERAANARLIARSASMLTLLEKALPPIRAEAERRESAAAPNWDEATNPYWVEMRELADEIEREIREAGGEVI